jgi:hypothetical protein
LREATGTLLSVICTSREAFKIYLPTYSYFLSNHPCGPITSYAYIFRCLSTRSRRCAEMGDVPPIWCLNGSGGSDVLRTSLVGDQLYLLSAIPAACYELLPKREAVGEIHVRRQAPCDGPLNQIPIGIFAITIVNSVRTAKAARDR